MQEIKNIKCPKCGKENTLGAKKCVKCHTLLPLPTKSCPRCAKKNKLEVEKCVNCGFRFNKKQKSPIFNLVIAILLILVLAGFVYIDHAGWVSNINKGFKICAILGILILFYTTINYGTKEKINYKKEMGIVEDNNKFNKMKKISNIIIIIGGIIVFGILIYVYYFK